MSKVCLLPILLLCSCVSSSKQLAIAGFYYPSHEGDTFTPCNSEDGYLILGENWGLVEARSAASKSNPSSAYIEAVAELEEVPDAMKYIPLKGAYRITSVGKAIPATYPSTLCGNG